MRRRPAAPAALLLALLAMAACDGWPEDAPLPPPAPPPPGSVGRAEPARLAALASPGPVVDAALLHRGAERYAIWCAPCHGVRGLGDGPVAGRGGFPPLGPLRADAAASMAAIAGNLAGAHPFDDRIPPRDRWAIAHFAATLPAAAPGAAR